MRVSHLTFLFFLTYSLSQVTTAQWSTSTYAESSLYVCPGFYPGIVTYNDGSSIILGSLQNYIFAQKLDPYGYKQWIQPVQILYNDSSDITAVTGYQNWGGWVSDGDYGVIVFWYDHRGAYLDPNEGYKNSSIYAQRVDKNGVIRWTIGGVKIKGPETGLKQGGIVSDGKGGFVISWTDRGFDYPGAPNKSLLSAIRYDQDAHKIWETLIDSSFIYWPFFYDVFRGGQRLYIRYAIGGNYSRVIDDQGGIITKSPEPVFGIVSEGDSLVYVDKYSSQFGVYRFTVHKLNGMGDTLWTTLFDVASDCNELVNFIPDGYNGVYFTSTCSDTIIHVNSLGLVSEEVFTGISFGGQAFFDGNHGLIVTSVTTAKRFEQTGQMLWPSPVEYLQDPLNAYFRLTASDNNGGVIVAFWTTLGGIFCQHTGRNGKVGVITNINETLDMPKDFSLSQNYPNPFNPTTTIEFTLNQRTTVELSIFDLLGKKVTTLVDGALEAGTHRIMFDGSKSPSGTYFYRFSKKNNHTSKRMMLIR